MQNKEKILVVDDDKAVLDSTSDMLSVRNYYTDTASSGEEALNKVKTVTYDLVITDLMMVGMDGIELLKEIKKLSPDTVVIVISGYGSMEIAIEATKLGAYDFIPKPFNEDEMLLRINRGLESRRRELERNILLKQIEEKYSFNNIISKESSMRKIFDQIVDISQTDATVIIFGETGTGKEMIANAIHYNSHRKDKPFIPVHCAALSETLLESELFGHEKGAFTGAFKQKKGRFELADGGTIFLDEVGDIPLVTQVKLLRVLQEKTFERVGGTELIRTDIRIITATNKDLLSLIKTGTFREDLYYRLNVFPINLPPLRERKNDIPLLVEHCIKNQNQKLGKNIKGISEESMKNMLNYSWPGNIRELENVIERAMLTAKEDLIRDINFIAAIEKQHQTINEDIEDYKNFYKNIMGPVEKDYFIQLIKKYKGDVDTIIEKMGISKRTFYNRIKEFEIDLEKSI
jgi:DNA-binding NtrC family response regulator